MGGEAVRREAERQPVAINGIAVAGQSPLVHIYVRTHIVYHIERVAAALRFEEGILEIPSGLFITNTSIIINHY